MYAEKEMAVRTAVKYSFDNIFDYIELTPEYSIYEIPVPPAWAGRSIVQLAIRTRYHISILATKTGESIAPLPGAEHVFQDTERLIILGCDRDVRKFL